MFGRRLAPLYVPRPSPVPVMSQLPLVLNGAPAEPHSNCDPALGAGGTLAGIAVEGGYGKGSSTSKTASDRFRVFRILLVMFTFRKIWMFAFGTGMPTGVGTPPVQIRTMSPTSSVTPSAL